MSMKVHSFDVFDTCVSRHLAYPRDLFYALGLELCPSDLSSDERDAFAKRFRRLRIRAEKQAYRSARPRQGATLSDIYRHFEPPPGLVLPNAAILAAEVELERRNIYAVPEILAELQRLRSEGKRLIFVSDMYLPASILSPLLVDLGVKRDGENLYVSCDAGLSKHSGRLYAHVLKQENLEPVDVLHVGDNAWADVRMPETLGITARRFQAATLTPHERSIAGGKVSTSIQSSTLAAFSRQSRLAAWEQDGGAAMPLDDAIHTYITPLLISYVAWVLEQARGSGIKRLYFVARDGEVMHKIASRLQGSDPGIELRYLYGSRRAWLTPSIIRSSSTWRKLIATPGQSNMRPDMLARIGLS
ncbi:MAG TPA: HAD family hydrolase, partial [Chthonomonadales bacterium]|nr:HAD family hydrolase [Chthonomonadales bacterium]